MKITFSKVIGFSIFLFAIATNFTVFGNETNSATAVICSTQYQIVKPIPNFRFNCSVVIPKNAGVFNYTCSNFDHRSLTVSERPENTLFVCTSNYAITVDVKFTDQATLENYLNMTWRREVVDFTDNSTYTYHLQIFPPKEAFFNYWGEAVIYTFSSVQHPSETINLVCYSSTKTNNVFWMNNKRELNILEWAVNRTTIYIPCFSDISYELLKYNNTGVLNYTATTYGIFLNAKNNQTELLGNYRCFNPLSKYTTIALNFSIVYRPSYYSSSHSFYYNGGNFSLAKVGFMNSESHLDHHLNISINTIIIDSDGVELALTCQLRNQNPSFVITKSLGDDRDWRECNSATKSSIDVFNNETRNTVACVTSNLEIDEKLYYICVEKKSKKQLEIWQINRKRALNKNGTHDRYAYLPKRNEMECYGKYQHDQRIREKHCNNPKTCEFVEPILKKEIQRSLKSSCSRHRHGEKCDVTKLSQKGILICKSNFDKNKWNTVLFNVYFVGLNSKMYIGVGTDPPNEAIIKAVSIGPNVQTMIMNDPVEFKVCCEAHSFYFEEGVQWLFGYANGTQQIIYPEYIADDIHDTSNACRADKSNPFSIVNILVPDKNIVRIICAAPRLSILKLVNFKQWVLEEINISIFDGIAPSILDAGSEFSFQIGDLNKEVICQATGLPKPEIHWNALSGQNLPPDFIIDLSIYSVLRFPFYNESNKGDYMCTAINAVGNVSKIISVKTKDEDTLLSVTQLVLMGTGCMSTLIIVLVVTFCWYYRKMKMKQSMEMDNILKLLEGENSVSNDNDINDCLKLHYDRNWELEKHSFCIDTSKILGCGEFGIVFKGTIAKLNIDVAFKSLKSKENLIHLKSLVSELKLLLYIGKHPNIVELYGAYTQEIRQGIIYVALEFCALGSLQSYLRSNKGRFEKCDFLTSYFENADTLPESKNPRQESSKHTIQSLLKWCSEISSAMNYLHSKKVLHGDLAARNILLSVDWTSKLTDFGLSRRTYYSDQYVKEGKDPLPWRWLALESLLTNVFNVKTDVWAFGITMWEIFSLGEIPYPGLSPTKEFVSELEKGLRNSKPKYASKEMYSVYIDYLKACSEHLIANINTLCTVCYSWRGILSGIVI